MTDLYVHYFVAYKFPMHSENRIFNKVVKVKLYPTEKSKQFDEIIRQVAEKSLLVDYYNENSLLSYEQFFRQNTVIINLTEL